MTFAQAMTNYATQYLRGCLAKAHGNAIQAALIAGVSRSRIYQLCARYDVPCGVRRKPRRPKPNPFASWHLPSVR